MLKEQKVYTYFIKDLTDSSRGILLKEGEDWLLIHSITDFRFDGYELLQKKYIEYRVRNEHEIFVEEVLKANNRWHLSSAASLLFDDILLDIPLSTNELFQYLEDTVRVVFIIIKNEVGHMGYVDSCTNKSFYFRNINSRGVWDQWCYVHRKTTPRTIQFDTDYIRSLLLYNTIFVTEEEEEI